MRKEFELTDAQLAKLRKSAKTASGILPAFDALGKELGFDPGTVCCAIGKSDHFFTAETI